MVDESVCPICGCKEIKGTGNMSQYPEHYEKFFCSNESCEWLVGLIDNSRYISCREFPKFIIDF